MNDKKNVYLCIISFVTAYYELFKTSKHLQLLSLAPKIQELTMRRYYSRNFFKKPEAEKYNFNRSNCDWHE